MLRTVNCFYLDIRPIKSKCCYCYCVKHVNIMNISLTDMDMRSCDNNGQPNARTHERMRLKLKLMLQCVDKQTVGQTVTKVSTTPCPCGSLHRVGPRQESYQ